jgi:AhpD family alkylhydroperoxidase
MTTTTSVSPRMEQSKVNQLLGPALKSLYDVEAHLRKSTLEPELRELIKLRVSQINGCAYCIIYHRRDASNRVSLNAKFICSTPGGKHPNIQTENAPP